HTPPPTEVAATPLDEGRQAAAEDEVVLERAAAEQLGVDVGDGVVVSAQSAESGREDATLQVVGITDPLDSALVTTGPARILVTEQNAPAILGAPLEDLATSWHASVPEGSDPAEVA